MAIDIIHLNTSGEQTPICCVEYEYANSLPFASHPNTAQVRVYNQDSGDLDYSALLNMDEEDSFDLDPEVEADYIDQVMQDQADRAEFNRPDDLRADSF